MSDSEMSDEKVEALVKGWLRDNLEISVELQDKHGPSNSVTVGLRFKGENYSFTSETIHIPDGAT